MYPDVPPNVCKPRVLLGRHTGISAARWMRGYAFIYAWKQCAAGPGDRCSQPQTDFLGAKNFKELNQEHLKSALHSAGPLG